MPSLASTFLLNFALKNVNNLCNKIYYVHNFCLDHNIHIFAVTETWLHKDLSDSVINIPGYCIFRNDFPSPRPKHGICLYIHESIKAIVVNPDNQLPNTLSMYLPSFNLYLLAVYRPPSNSQDSNDSLISYILEFSLGKELIILGDFNLPSILWSLPVPDSNICHLDASFYNLFISLGLHQHVLEPTFVTSGNILDLVLTTDPDRIADLTLHPPFPHCGHALIKFSYVFQTSLGQPQTTNTQLDWPRGNYDALSSHINTYDWDFEFMHLPVTEMVNHLTMVLNNLSRCYVPVKKQQNNTPPWHKNVPIHIRTKKARCWADYIHHRRAYGRRSPIAIQKLYLFHAANSILRHAVISAKCNYEQNLVNQQKNRPKLFHSYIRHKKSARPSVGPLLVDNSLTDDAKDMANTFVEAFASVFVDEVIPNPRPHQRGTGTISSVAISVDKVEEVLKTLNTDSAMGPDNLHPFLLKKCSASLSYPFYLIFTKSLNLGLVPDKWKHAHVVPIFKKGPRTNPLNYRPISLTPIPCKCLERIITRTLYNFLDEYIVLDNNQYGFRARRSVSDQLLLTYENITHWYDIGLTVDLILFDFIKAFDRVHHPTLIDKLISIGIGGNLLSWIRDFLSHRTMSVAIKGTQSRALPVTSGVPQGSVLGPVLFLLFINHLGANLTCHYKLFADDLKLYIHHPSDPSQSRSQDLQDNINILSLSASSWGLSFSPSKCVHLHFKRGQPDRPCQYLLYDAPINTVPSHNDLGVIVDSKLRFHPHITNTVQKAGGIATNLLKSTICRTPSFMIPLLTSDIRPIIDFASCVWNTGFIGDLALLESVQRRWTKQISGMSTLSYPDRLSQLSLFSIKGRLLRTDLLQCYKIFHNLSPISPSDLFALAPRETRGHKFKIFVPQSSTEARKRFFSRRIISPWNSLPPDVVEAPSINLFKCRLNMYMGNSFMEP